MPQSTVSGAPYFRPQAQTSATLPPQQVQQSTPGLTYSQFLTIGQELRKSQIDATKKAVKAAGAAFNDRDKEASEAGQINSWQTLSKQQGSGSGPQPGEDEQQGEQEKKD